MVNNPTLKTGNRTPILGLVPADPVLVACINTSSASFQQEGAVQARAIIPLQDRSIAVVRRLLEHGQALARLDG